MGQMEWSPAARRGASWPVVSAEGRGHERAFVRALYEREATRIRSTMARLAGPGLDADDMMQEVFLVALRRPKALAEARSPKAWLYGVAVKAARARRRHSRLRQFFGLEAAQDVPDPSTPAEALDRDDARQSVRRILEKLSERKRAVFVLFELEGLTGEEISQALGCPLKTVWSRLHHARREFAAHLARLQLSESRRAA
jgi:RNA polymerase sigma-70 factor (ECF subfamily)